VTGTTEKSKPETGSEKRSYDQEHSRRPIPRGRTETEIEIVTVIETIKIKRSATASCSKQLPQVRYLARRIQRTPAPAGAARRSGAAGVIGLIDALKQVSTAPKHVQFGSYAKFRIRGAILDSLREDGLGTAGVAAQKPGESKRRSASSAWNSAAPPPRSRCRRVETRFAGLFSSCSPSWTASKWAVFIWSLRGTAEIEGPLRLSAPAPRKTRRFSAACAPR